MEREGGTMTATLPAEVAPPRGRRRLSTRSKVRALQLAGVVSFFALWQVAGSAKPRFYSTPQRVFDEIVVLFTEEDLAGTALGSLYALVLGLGLAFAIGVTSGLLIGRYHVLRVMAEPYMAAFYSVPRVAFIPILVVWFGIEREFVVASVVFASAILITFSTAAGVLDAVLRYTEVAESFGVKGRHFFVKVLLPAAVPFVANGTRLSIQRALVAVIVAEFLVGVPGLGFVIRTARVTLDADRLFAMAILLMILGVILFNLTTWIEQRLSSWRPQAF